MIKRIVITKEKIKPDMRLKRQNSKSKTRDVKLAGELSS